MSGLRLTLFRQAPRALVVSALAAALDVTLLALLVELLGALPWLGATLGYFAGGVLQYWLSSVWVFQKPGPGGGYPGARFLAFQVMSLAGLAITWLSLWAGAKLGVHYLFAKVVALGLAFVWNFGTRKLVIFRA